MIDDLAAGYWANRIRLGFGDSVVLRGQYGHNLYGSIQSYGVSTSTGSLLRTDQIIPDPGSVNPFVQGNPRNLRGSKRWFTIRVLNEPKPANEADFAPNTLYARPPTTDPDQTLVDLRWRSYMADQKYDDAYDARGGAQLPFPTKILRAPSTTWSPKQSDASNFFADRFFIAIGTPTNRRGSSRTAERSGAPIDESRLTRAAA